MKEVLLSQGKVAIVDDDMFEYLSQWKWSFQSTGYAVRHQRDGKKDKLILLHREVIQAPDGIPVDHVNGDKLDCRRMNLRLTTPCLNNANRGIPKNNTTGFKGVSWNNSRTSPYKAEIKLFGRKIYLGCFEKAEDAARAYDAKAKELFGEFARTNFK